MQNVGPDLWKLLKDLLGETVSKKNLKGPIERLQARQFSLHPVEPSKLSEPEQTRLPAPQERLIAFSRPDEVTSPWLQNIHTQQDWGNAPNTEVFYGRTKDLAQLEQWIRIDGCRLVTLFGVGGVGKTLLSARLAQQIKDQFEFLIWRSLDRPPHFQDLLCDLIQSLGGQSNSQTDLPHLLYYLSHHRCLLVLDGWESTLQAGVHDGSYHQAYQDYGELLKQVGQRPHQSCIVLTSREKPKEVAVMEGEVYRVRSLNLNGLGELSLDFFINKGSFVGLESDWRVLIQRYNGNPFALNVVATYIRDVFNGNLASFLEQLRQELAILGDIGQLLEQQFERLSKQEKIVVYGLANYGEPATFADILQLAAPSFSRVQLQEVLQSLRRRSLIEISTGGYILHSLMLEYVRNQASEAGY